MNEQSTRAALIDPALRQLGWAFDVDVTCEHALQTAQGQRFADYCLWHGDEIILVVEAKAATRDAEDGVQQAIEYSQAMGLRFGLATNGTEVIRCDNLLGTTVEFDRLPTKHEVLKWVEEDRRKAWEQDRKARLAYLLRRLKDPLAERTETIYRPDGRYKSGYKTATYTLDPPNLAVNIICVYAGTLAVVAVLVFAYAFQVPEWLPMSNTDLIGIALIWQGISFGVAWLFYSRVCSMEKRERLWLNKEIASVMLEEFPG